MSSSETHVHGEYVNKLHNWIQEAKKDIVTSISWEETASGTEHDPQWTVVCKVDGEVRGTGMASKKKLAKDIAAKKAMIALGALQEDA